ncbi:helix-turn-helix transcriptional regulator [Ruminococcus sp.]|uniref:helix-turn-helix domain-containing protein n=1 Tax=Ruminococcus sp. TaxID=41978 RepID=UPI0025FE0928|nr:helix-turn-helix transcriptional regulator [Ruminococcus sp.]MBQ8967357.1 helix-turn-helix transcriptional regulator [Ruminococcus sp.]
MDQVKTGRFLRELRKERGMTQEQLAEKFGVTARTVSRWENGNNMPDISLLIELADHYDVDIRQLIDGERKSESMDTELKETLVKVAEYTEEEKNRITTSLLVDIVIAAAGFLVLFVITALRDSPAFVGRIKDGTAELIAITDFAVMCGGVINILQLKGKINKGNEKRLLRVGIVTAGVVLAAAIVMIVLMMWKIFS